MSVDPIYAYFDVDEHTVQRVRRMVHEDQDTAAGDAPWPVSLALSTETGFPHQGTINFVDNQVAAKTGTLRVRGVFPNPDGKLLPGFFARVRIPIGPPHPALVVNDRALDNDQGQKSSTSSTTATKWSCGPCAWGRCTTGCGRSLPA